MLCNNDHVKAHNLHDPIFPKKSAVNSQYFGNVTKLYWMNTNYITRYHLLMAGPPRANDQFP